MEELDKNKIEEEACLASLKMNYLYGLINEELTDVFYLELKKQIGENILKNKPIIESILKKYNIDYKIKGCVTKHEIYYTFEYKKFDIKIILSRESNKIYIHVPYSKHAQIKTSRKLKKEVISKDRMGLMYFNEIITEEDFLQKMNYTLANFNETFE